MALQGFIPTLFCVTANKQPCDHHKVNKALTTLVCQCIQWIQTMVLLMFLIKWINVQFFCDSLPIDIFKKYFYRRRL